MTRIALFDLDGTITDSGDAIIGSLRRALRALGHAPDPLEDLRWTVGPPMEQSMERLLAPYGDTRAEEATVLYRRFYAEGGMFACTLYPGIEAALAAFAADGFRLFVATAKRTRYAVPILEHFGLARHFAGIHGSEEGPRLDTKPELLAHVASLHRIDAGRAVMIGDRSYDIEGARANGMKAIAAAWGYGGPGEHDAADAVAPDPAALLPIARRLLG